MFCKQCYKSEFKWIQTYCNRLGYCRSQTFQTCWYYESWNKQTFFLKLSFANKGLDGINLGNILHHKSVKSKIPPYFKDQSLPIISYVYTIPIVSKIVNYKHVLHDLNIDDFKSKPPGSTCAEVFAKGPKYREPNSINWKHKFKILMNSVEDYSRQWAKCDKEDLDTLYQWVKSVRSLIQIIIKKESSGSMSTRSTLIFKDSNVSKHLSLLHDKCYCLPPSRYLALMFLGVNYIECLIKELGIDNSLGNPTYTPTTLTKEEILDNHRSVLCSFGI